MQRNNPYSNVPEMSESRLFDDDRSLFMSPTTSSARGSPEPLIRRNHRAAFLQGNDPSLTRDHALIEDAIRMRNGQAEFAPTQLSLQDSTSSLGHGSSTTHLIPASSSPMLRDHSSTSSLNAAIRERPKTRYEDFEAGQAKLLTQASSHTYDIMPDIALLNNFAPEKDDALHDPGSKAPRFGPDRRIGEPGGAKAHLSLYSARGLLNAGALLIIILVLVAMFAIYPIITYVISATTTTLFTNSSGMVPEIQGFRGLIDLDTPESAYTRTGFDGEEYTLVFSDEFELDGRTFYPGDDPYWTAVDTHYYATDNLEWYDPSKAWTADGSLIFNMSRENPNTNHGFNFSSGMLQSWNQFCFTGGYIEVAVNLPGSPKTPGFWPGAWTMGNLGRAGYGASNEGTWPYSYDACDIGTLPNQTFVNGSGPAAALEHDEWSKGLSYLPGQKLSACTCKGEDHPGPWLSDENRYRGRSAPEIDILEATVENDGDDYYGTVSQSAQYAPYDGQYLWHNVSDEDFEIFPDVYEAQLNSYKGGVYQESVSALPETDQKSYELINPDRFQTYGYEYLPSQYSNSSHGTAFISWMQGGNVTWTLKEPGMRANPDTLVSQRLISDEPMYAILNFGMSYQFAADLNFDDLVFPAIMKVDYVRIYQRKDLVNIGCDPAGYPTTKYIDEHLEAYMNPNLTIWSDYTDAGFPKNSLIDDC